MDSHEYANLFPMMPDGQLSSLAESIRKTKQDHPITVFEGKILDGRNRWKACEIAGKPPLMEDFLGTKEDALQFVLDHNLECRRHLTESQRAMIASRLATMRSGERTDLPPIGERLPHKDRQAAATDLNVGTSSLDRARRAQKTGVPELLKAVDDGEISVNAAAELAKLPAARQLEVLAEGPDAVKEKAKEIRDFGGEIAPAPKADGPKPRVTYRPALGHEIAQKAIATLERIGSDDREFEPAYRAVIDHCNERLAKKRK